MPENAANSEKKQMERETDRQTDKKQEKEIGRQIRSKTAKEKMTGQNTDL